MTKYLGTSWPSQVETWKSTITVESTDQVLLLPIDVYCMWSVFLNISFPSPGIIYLTSTLSHLESTTLTLVVRAQDGGGLTSVINANITIHILQTTLAPSEFERPKYTFSVYEDAPENSPVGTVKAKESLSKYFLCCIGICYWNIPCISLGCALLKKPFLLSM